jgi:glycosyltransferase involved in cell wall biosynthesis
MFRTLSMQQPRKIKVLLVTDEMEVGGSQRQIMRIATGLPRTSFEPAVAYFRNPSHLVDELERAGVRTHHVPKRRRIDPVFFLRLVGLLRRERYDVIHCFSFTAELWGALAHALVRRNALPALVSSIRGTFESYTPWQWRLKRWVTRRSCRVVANSCAGAEFARRQMGLPSGAGVVIYNGVDVPALDVDRVARARLRAALGIGAQTVVGLFVGRFVTEKNLPLLVRAAARLARERVDFVLLLVGDGPLRAEVERDLDLLGARQSVHLLGMRSDVMQLMAVSDFFVLSSTEEGLSNVILEAMAAGRPVIASAVGGNPELVEDGVTGMLFRSGDEEGLVRCMRALSVDAALRERLGGQGRRRAVERFATATMVGAVQSLYQQCAEASCQSAWQTAL